MDESEDGETISKRRSKVNIGLDNKCDENVCWSNGCVNSCGVNVKDCTAVSNGDDPPVATTQELDGTTEDGALSMDNWNLKNHAVIDGALGEKDSQRLVNCECFLENNKEKMLTGLCQDQQCNDTNDNGHIKDCSYVSVLNSTINQECNSESHHCSSKMKNIDNSSLIDKIDFASGTFNEHHVIGQICNARDILCECDLQANFSQHCDSHFDNSIVNFQQEDIGGRIIGETAEKNCLIVDIVDDSFSSGCFSNFKCKSTCLLEDPSDPNKNVELCNNYKTENLDDCLCNTEGIYDCPTESNELLSLENDNSSFDSSFSIEQAVLKEELLISDEMVNACKQNVFTTTPFGSEPVDNDSLMDTNTRDDGVNYQDALEEENVYEEIQRSGRSRCNESETTEQTILKRGSLVDEVMNEVERVEKGHAQILQELNLDIENLIMPNTPTTSVSIESSLSLDLSPDLLQTVNTESTNSSKNQCNNNNLSTRTLPPLPASSNETIPLLRSTPSYRNLYQTKSAPVNYQIPQTQVSSSSGVKQWFNRISSLSSFREKKSKLGSEKTRWRLSLRDTDDEPVYMLYDDSHRMHEAAKYEPDDEIYEDIDNISQTYTFSSVGGRNVQLSSFNKDKHSASTVELNDDFSDTDSVQSTGSLSVSRFKGKILNFGRKLSRQSDDKGKEIRTKLKLGEIDAKSESKLTRLFSKKKGYDLSQNKERDAVSTTCEEEQLPKLRMSMRQKSPNLPPVPPGLSPDQIKRRYIIGTLVHSENSYIESLKKLVNEYKKPLEESFPPILSPTKVATLFYRIPEILQCHINFCISLAACIRKWDKEETMGDVFVQAFSKTSVLDIYSDYINNFSIAVDLAKQESKRKSAFTDFLKVKQITSQDRLSLFGLMVKPVQRFPQFILLLQDLLKHTPQGHHDRLALQLALTQMETLTDILNERKRESDQAHAVKDILRHVSAKTAAKSLTEGSRHLLRQDGLTQLVFNQNGQWKKSKVCRLFLLNDLLVCVTVGPSDKNDSQKSERYTFKWSVPVNEIEIQEEASPILSNMVYAMSAGHQTTTTKSDNFNKEMEGVNCVYRELSDLLHDFEVMSRIMALVATLKKTYPDISKEIVQNLSQSIQQSIQKKDDEVKWIDSCCLQFSVPLKSKTGKFQRELMIFQSKSMDTKQEWLRDVRMSQLALDANNSPAWNIPESSKRCNTKTPLFVNAIPILSTRHMTEVKCGCCHRTMSARLLGRRSQDYVWLCSTDGVNSYISIHTLRQMGLRDVYRFDMTECRISTMESVPGFEVSKSNFSLTGDTVWMGTESRRVLVYSGSDVDHYREVGTAAMSASVLQIKYHLNQVYIALANGTVVCFRRENYVWQMKDFQVITLSSEPVTCLLPVQNSIFCGCGRKVWIIDCKTNKVIHSHSVHHDHMGSVYTMAHSGIGLWLNLRNTPLVCLYHAETFQHLQDVNISSSIRRILAEQNRPHSPRNYSVTALTAILGLLWIGTNVGVVLSIPLPRLQGLPILGRRANLAYHANIGPVSIILDLKSPSPLPQIDDRLQDNAKEKVSENRIANSLKDDLSEDGLSQFNVAKTLPRGWKPSVANIGNSECNIYGLYGNLINVREGTDEHSEEELRRSDPDLIPSLVSTLDRRLRLHSGRPRSLDLANLANLVSGNDASCVSSSSEDGGSITLSYTDLPGCNMTICSQIIESPETNKIDEECLIDHQDSNKSPVSSMAVNCSTAKRERIKTAVLKDQPVQRSIMTLIGGRGYIDLRKSATNKEQSIYSSSTSSSAYAILWEMKV